MQHLVKRHIYNSFVQHLNSFLANSVVKVVNLETCWFNQRLRKKQKHNEWTNCALTPVIVLILEKYANEWRTDVLRSAQNATLWPSFIIVCDKWLYSLFLCCFFFFSSTSPPRCVHHKMTGSILCSKHLEVTSMMLVFRFPVDKKKKGASVQ